MDNQIELLVDIGRHFAATQDIEATMAKALERITARLEAVGGGLFILEDEQLVCHASHGPIDVRGLSIPAGTGIVGRSVANNASEMVWDAQSDPSFNKSLDKQFNFTTRSILCVPLSVKDECFGAIEVINKTGGDGLFSDADLQLLEALAASAALAITNARMAGELAEKEVMRRELELAAEIQRGLLPQQDDTQSAVCGVNRPARVVSGDFFDYFPLYDGRIAFTLADVSGKGMNAALLMAKAASLFRCLGKETLRPGRLLQRINAEVCETALRGMFITMVVGTYDPKTGRVVLANAGHEPPLFYSTDGTFLALEAGAPPVGIPPELTGGGPVPEQELNLAGGALYVFTDGATEGYIGADVELGAQGFQDMIQNGRRDGLSSFESITAVADRLTQSGQTLRDDVTILVVDDASPLRQREKNAEIKDNMGNTHPGIQEGSMEKPIEGSICVLSLPARAESLKLVRQAVDQAALGCGFAKEQCQDIVLAVDEACQNVVRHAYGEATGDMEIDIRRERGAFMILVRDFAPKVDVAKIKPRDLDDVRPGGLGVHFIREVMDDVEYLPPPAGEGNVLRLKKTLPS